MNSFEPFSKRIRKRERLGTSDVYQYDTIPTKFRIQVIHIWSDTLGKSLWILGYQSKVNPLWLYLYKKVIREFGITNLIEDSTEPIREDFNNYFLSADVEQALDMIDLVFHVIDNYGRYSKDATRQFTQSPIDNIYSDFTNFGTHFWETAQEPEDAIDELNRRFREHNIGYTFEGGELIRIDSQYIHKEVVKPAISLLQEVDFQGAEEEFFKAHKHYRNGENKEAVVNALKAFESTIKAICEIRHWPYDSTAPASKLIGVILDKDKQFLPSMLESSLTGLATIRNKTSGHGQGIEVVDVPQYLASYTLHLAASNIVLLVEAHKAKLIDDLDDLEPF